MPKKSQDTKLQPALLVLPLALPTSAVDLPAQETDGRKPEAQAKASLRRRAQRHRAKRRDPVQKNRRFNPASRGRY